VSISNILTLLSVSASNDCSDDDKNDDDSSCDSFSIDYSALTYFSIAAFILIMCYFSFNILKNLDITR
jgi:hypothetical protein